MCVCVCLTLLETRRPTQEPCVCEKEMDSGEGVGNGALKAQQNLVRSCPGMTTCTIECDMKVGLKRCGRHLRPHVAMGSYVNDVIGMLIDVCVVL